MRRILLLGLLFLLPVKAHAAWMEASSAHFVVYADTDQKNLRRFSEQLERYDAAMALITGLERDTPSPSNRVTVYVVGSVAKMQQIYGLPDKARVGGFYIPRAGGSVAIIPTVGGGTAEGDQLDYSMVTLLHEYAHHFLLSRSGFPTPRWLGEGSADFFASASFGSDGGMVLGRPSLYREAQLLFSRDVTTNDLFDSEGYERRRGKGMQDDAYYGKAWLLYHYLAFEPKRKGQLATYAKELIAGKSALDAARAAFGDFKVLESELDKYQMRTRLTAIGIKPTALKIGLVTIRALGGGEAAAMPVRIRSRRGVDSPAKAKAILADARAVAAKFPKDPAVLSTLTEALVDTENYDEAIATADTALAVDPNNVDILVQKGKAMFARAGKANDPKAFRDARAPFLAANKIEHDHPLPLVYFYLTYVRAGLKPTPNAVDALKKASELAPFDLGLRMMMAMQELRDGERAAARLNLLPVAYNPHGEAMAAKAKEMIARIDADPKWNGWDLNLGEDEPSEGD